MSENTINAWLMIVLSNQQSKIQIYSIYYHRGLRKPVNIHIWEAGSSEFLAFLHLKTFAN